MNIILRPLLLSLLSLLFSFALLSISQAEKTKSLSSRIRLYEEKSKAYDSYIEEQLKELKKIKQNFYLNHVIGTKRTDERRKTISAEMELIGLIENYMKAKRDFLKAITKCIPYDKDADIADVFFFNEVNNPHISFNDVDKIEPFDYNGEFKVLFDLLRERLGKFSPDGFICRFGELPPRKRLSNKLEDVKKVSNWILKKGIHKEFNNEEKVEIRPITNYMFLSNYLREDFDDSFFYMAKLKYMGIDRYGAAFLPRSNRFFMLIDGVVSYFIYSLSQAHPPIPTKDLLVATIDYLASYEELVPVLCNYVEWR